MKKTIQQLEGLEVTIIGTVVRHPETFRQVRDILRPVMFSTEEGRAIAGKVWPLMATGKFSGPLLAADLDERLRIMVNHAATQADPDNVRSAAEILSANWADAEYHRALEGVAMNWNTFSDWREADTDLNEAKRNILNMATGKAQKPEEVIDGLMEDLWAGLLGKKLYSGLPTGFADLDDLTGGWMEGQQVIVAGRPGMGKTRFAVQQAYQAAKDGRGVVFFSLEIGKEMIYRYFLSLMTAIPVQKMKTYNMTKDESDQIVEASKLLKAMPLYVVDDVFSMEDILFSAQELAEQMDVGLIVVDYIQLIGKAGRKSDNRNNELSEISRSLKQLARMTNATTIVLSQLSRKVEERQGRRPILSDLRDSGAIEADADVVVFPFHPSYYDEHTELPDEIIVAKQRDGEIGSVRVQWKSPGFYFEATQAPNALPELSLNGKAQHIDENSYLPF